MLGTRHFCFLLATAGVAWGITTDDLVKSGAAAEARFDSRKALEFYLAASSARPNDATILQKVAQQYSDAIVDLDDRKQKILYAQKALDYAQKAVALEPHSAVNVLSLAVCHGTLAVYSETHDKIAYSRLVKEEAERALAIDPNYSWAHHVLGRWNYEVASLGFATQWVVKSIYGGLPPASIDTGIAELKKAVQLEPTAVAHRLELGFAELAAGKKNEARQDFEKGLAMPSHEKHDEAAKKRARDALSEINR